MPGAIQTYTGPRWANRHHLGPKNGQKNTEKAAHTLPKSILSMNEDIRPCWRPSQSRRTPFLLILVISARRTQSRPKLGKTRQKGSPHIARVDSAHEQGQRTAPVSELPGPFGDLGPALGLHQARTESVPFGCAEAQRRQEQGELNPQKSDAGWVAKTSSP